MILASALRPGEHLVEALIEPEPEIIAREQFDLRIHQIWCQLLANAPITIKAIKQAQRRLKRTSAPDDEDLMRTCYGSNNFYIGIEAFLRKKAPDWTRT
jgi:enoyl-CoA hydratase